LGGNVRIRRHFVAVVVKLSPVARLGVPFVAARIEFPRGDSLPD
jgi:hypothetical protein